MLIGSVGLKSLYECEVCGRYDVSSTALQDGLDTQHDHLTAIQRAILSHRIREANDTRSEAPLLTTDELEYVIANGRLPTPAQQALNIIRFVGNRVGATGEPIDNLPPSFPAAVGSPNRNSAMGIARQLMRGGLLNAIEAGDMQLPNEIIRADLTLAGWERYEAEQQGQLSSNYGFIALKFGDEVLDPFVADVIKPAATALGFELVDMRDVAEAGIIDNVMRARIRDAAFVLVDLTHANEGAYWEAGYAEGLGKPVLYLCNRQVFQEKGTHFDTNHCTTVLWDPAQPDPFTEELKATLRRSLGLFAS
jgi:nucleoside 2-deoxyribosyltransferase